jgi:hypothetical protein
MKFRSTCYHNLVRVSSYRSMEQLHPNHSQYIDRSRKPKVNASNKRNMRNTTSTKETRDLDPKFTPMKGSYVSIKKPTKSSYPFLSQPTIKIKIDLLTMTYSTRMGDINLPGLPTRVGCSMATPSHLVIQDSKSNKSEMVPVGVSKAQEMDEMHSNKLSQATVQSHFKSRDECSRVKWRSGNEC